MVVDTSESFVWARYDKPLIGDNKWQMLVEKPRSVDSIYNESTYSGGRGANIILHFTCESSERFSWQFSSDGKRPNHLDP